MKAVIPFQLVEGLKSKNDRIEYEKFKNEITQYSSNSSLIYYLTSHSKSKEYLKEISFEITNTLDDGIKDLNSKYNFYKDSWTSDCLIIHCSFGHDWGDKDDYYAYVTTEILMKFSLLIHLSYVFSVSFMKGIVFAPSQKFVGVTDPIRNNFMHAFWWSEELGWPISRSLDFDKTINWFRNGEMNSDRLSINKAHTAVNALSYFFANHLERDSADLFWAVLGIEALYAEGNVDIQKQIKQKTALVLGQPKEYKKKLNDMYNYRSRLIHGDLFIPPKFADILDEFNPEYWDNLHFALSILIASIKILIEENIYKFEFETLWKKNK